MSKNSKILIGNVSVKEIWQKIGKKFENWRHFGLIFIGRGGKRFSQRNLLKFVEICQKMTKNLKILIGNVSVKEIWQKIGKKFENWHHFGMIFFGRGGKSLSLREICRNLSKFVKKVKRFENWRHFGMIFIGGQTENVSLSEIG